MNNRKGQNSLNSGTEENMDENKRVFIYYNFHQLYRKRANPFCIPIRAVRHWHMGLADTRADVLIMHVDNIPLEYIGP